VHASIALFTASAGDLDEAAWMARRLTGESGAWPKDGRWIVTVALMADLVADLDDKESAEVLYPMLAPFADQSVAGGSGTVASDGSVSRHLGRLAALCGRLAAAEGHFRDAIAFEDRMGARPFAATSRMYLAEVLRARGGPQNLAAAAREARTALAAMRALDMQGRAATCAQLVTALHSDLAKGTVVTPREREIVVLVADGLSNRQIAQQLFVSERTVETHVSHVLTKLGASKRIDIATWAVAGGLSSGQT